MTRTINETGIRLGQLASNIELKASASGVSVLLPDTADSVDCWLRLPGLTQFGMAFFSVIPILCETEIANISERELFISSDNVYALYDSEFRLAAYLPDLAPFKLIVDARGNFGYPECRLTVSWRSGHVDVYLKEFGTFVQRGQSVHLLPLKTWSLLCEIKSFNEAPDSHRSNLRECLIQFARINELATRQVEFEEYLKSMNVVRVSKLEVELVYETDGRVSVLPSPIGVSKEDFWKAYRRIGRVDSTYDITSGGTTVRVLPDDDVINALKVIRPMQHLSAADKHRLLCNPAKPFYGKTDLDKIDLSGIKTSSREVQRHVEKIRFENTSKTAELVLDCGEHESVRIPLTESLAVNEIARFENGLAFIRNPATHEELIALHDDRFDGVLIEAREAVRQRTAMATVEIPKEEPIKAANESDKMEIDGPEARDASPYLAPLDAAEAVKRIGIFSDSAVQGSYPNEEQPRPVLNNKPVIERPAGEASIEYTIQECESTTLLVAEEPAKLSIPQYSLRDPIDSEDDLVDDQTNSESCFLNFVPPRSLMSAISGKKISLKRYQREGIAWLQYSYQQSKQFKNPKRGVLLADDMGLGKTLQVLCFLAWLLENSRSPTLTATASEYRPVIIVAPLILLSVWEAELQKFFRNSGQVFAPYVVLHGERLKEFRSYKADGTSLDARMLRAHQLIITNYDTLKNHIDAFEQLKLSIVIADEAQEIKDSNTAKSKCLKALNADFKIALTGTPVENKLADLWSIVDFVQPGLLGTERQFAKHFESNLDKISESERRNRATELRKRLNFDSPRAFVVRRTKLDNLEGLPRKVEHLIYSELTEEQISCHQELIQYGKTGGPGSALTAVQKLMSLYQHKALILDSDAVRSVSEYLEQSPKLHSALSVLEEISKRREKALIFTRSLKMQCILQQLVAQFFGHSPAIINGSRTGESRSSTGGNYRKRLIEDFEKREGFNTLILSPEVAGVGLTIVGANNVLHYGRWWNPAVESQATDRCYRLGQTRSVNVYYPISVSDSIKSFDERLHKLLWHKKCLAADFLVPSEKLSINQSDLFADLVEEDSASNKLIPIDGSYLSGADVEQLEAIYAAVLRKQGCEVFITRRDGEGRCIFLARGGKTVQLILCRTNEQRALKDDVRELLELKDRLVGEGMGHSLGWQVIVVCNHRILTRAAVEKSVKVELVDEQQVMRLLKKHPISVTDVLREIDCRVTFQQLRQALVV